jgi:hypothetical protein
MLQHASYIRRAIGLPFAVAWTSRSSEHNLWPSSETRYRLCNFRTRCAELRHYESHSVHRVMNDSRHSEKSIRQLTQLSLLVYSRELCEPSLFMVFFRHSRRIQEQHLGIDTKRIMPAVSLSKVFWEMPFILVCTEPSVKSQENIFEVCHDRLNPRPFHFILRKHSIIQHWILNVVRSGFR